MKQDMNNNVLMSTTSLELQKLHEFSVQNLALSRYKLDEQPISKWAYSNPFPGSLSPTVNVELQNRQLWQKFYEQGTEMIITKSGRRMFPSIQLNVTGLQKREHYYILMEIAPASNRRHKYCGNGGGNDENENKGGNIRGWSFAGPAEPQLHFNHRLYMHPDSPATGDHWMENPVSFSKLKLTNSVASPNDNMVLTSMHKYIPKIWIIRSHVTNSLNELFSRPASSYSFKETEFIAVTAYQNVKITKLKINYNPFAKGFREMGRSRCKRKINQIDPAHSSQGNDEVVNPSVELDKNHNMIDANNLKNVSQKLRKLEIKNSNDDADRSLVSTTEDQTSSSRKENNDNEIHFHRPWLSPISRNKVTGTPSISCFSPVVDYRDRELLSYSSYIHNWYLYHIGYESFMQRDLAECQQYQYSSIMSSNIDTSNSDHFHL